MDKNELNQELYKKAINQIHAPEDLKRKTLEKLEKNNHKNLSMNYMKFATVCAVIVVAVVLGMHYVPENNSTINKDNDLYSFDNFEDKNVKNRVKDEPAEELANLNTFKDIEELKIVLEEHTTVRTTTKGADDLLIMTDSVATAQEESATNKESASYSTTNIQVQGVDEADIIKTDGTYIYYISFNVLHVIKADSLEEITTVDYQNNGKIRENFNAKDMYLVKDKLVVLGDYYSFIENTKRINDDFEDIAYIRNSSDFAQAIIYDVSSPKDIKEIRKIKLDGSYTNSRMIGNNLYFISNSSPYYYKGITDEEILPCYIDSEEQKQNLIPANRIIYFPNTNSYNYILIAGVDISKNEPINVESFFGAWSTNIYSSQENLYIPICRYDYSKNTQTNEIYKFSLNESKVKFVAKGIVEGYLDSQFSIDEYNGFLRIATTTGYDKNSTNTLYVLDKNLEEVSKLVDIARGEKIYSVRFMGKVGYIVTFEQIDPLFVVDLSDPYNPQIKGELEIPGYSSYLHPYDENHIIGIGYNVKSNGYGGVKNANMKMAMFDVSDLENPKEMFSIDIGTNHVYSELERNHKALFYNKEKDLIGFSIQDWEDNSFRSPKNIFTVYKIDLEKGFTVHGQIANKQDYRTDIKRAIYIGDYIYTLSTNQVIKYNLENFEKISDILL